MGCCGSTENGGGNVALGVDTTPLRVRRCRDVIPLILFIAAIGGSIYLSVEAVKRGDPGRYIYGSDSWGNVCGREVNKPIEGVSQSGRNLTEQSFEFYTALSDLKMALDPTQYVAMESGPAVLCIKKCPTEPVTKCTDLLQENGYNIDENLIQTRVCQMPAGIILPHTAVVNRCVPSAFTALGEAVSEAGTAALAPELMVNNQTKDNLKEGSSMAVVTQQVVSSVTKYWDKILYLILISIGVSLIMILLLQLFTRILVVVIITVAAVGTVGFTSYLWYTYLVTINVVEHQKTLNLIDEASAVLQNDPDIAVRNGRLLVHSRTTGADNIVNGLSVEGLQESKYLLPMAIISSVITSLILILLIYIRKSLCLVVSLFDESSLALFSLPAMLLQPVYTVIAFSAVLIWFLIIAGFIYSSQNPKVDSDGMVKWVEMVTFPYTGIIVPHIFMFFWAVQFIFACQEIILAGAVSGWFFAKGVVRKKCKCNLCATLRPTKDLILFNLGSAALGSLIIAIVWFIRTVLAYAQKKLKNNNNKVALTILRCLSCCLACFEKVLKYINRNAYICVAMYGDGFCSAAKKALSLLVANAQHVAAINCVSGFCLLLGKVGVTVSIVFIGMAWFIVDEVPEDQYFAPLCITGVCSYFVASCFFAVYGISIDTIFMCFCDDQQRNNGKDRPYYSSNSLRKYMSAGVADNKPSSSQPAENQPPQAVPPSMPQASAGPKSNFYLNLHEQNIPIYPLIQKQSKLNMKGSSSFRTSNKTFKPLPHARQHQVIPFNTTKNIDHKHEKVKSSLFQPTPFTYSVISKSTSLSQAKIDYSNQTDHFSRYGNKESPPSKSYYLPGVVKPRDDK